MSLDDNIINSSLAEDWNSEEDKVWDEETSLWSNAAEHEFNSFLNSLSIPTGFSGEHTHKLNKNNACLVCNRFILGSK